MKGVYSSEPTKQTVWHYYLPNKCFSGSYQHKLFITVATPWIHHGRPCVGPNEVRMFAEPVLATILQPGGPRCCSSLCGKMFMLRFGMPRKLPRSGKIAWLLHDSAFFYEISWILASAACSLSIKHSCTMPFACRSWRSRTMRGMAFRSPSPPALGWRQRGPMPRCGGAMRSDAERLGGWAVGFQVVLAS